MSVDSRIVTMKFDNAAFQRGVSSTMSSLSKLKSALDFGATSKLGDAGKNFNLSGMGSQVDGLSAKFVALSTVAITALANITNRAVDAGLGLAKSLTLDPIMQGFSEYETNMNSIQTILSNTGLEGKKGLNEVNGALEELNTYADKTIYNFSEMARNIGTFTAAGVDLKTSTAAIKGIANLAAISGSNSNQASTAMYQLSQALAAGKVNLMDWNSVVNAGMGGKVFQEALLRTAKNMGTVEQNAVKAVGPMGRLQINGESFRESLSSKPGEESWLTSDVLTNTLKQLSGDMTAAQLKAEGFSDAQTEAILKMGRTGQSAAQDVKTLSQLMGTLQEAVGSGWAKTWQLVFGDFGEAKTTFTGVSNFLGEMIGASADSRNAMLKDWKQLGGRTVLIDSIKNAFQALLSIIRPFRDAFRDVFPAMTGERLYELTVMLRNFTERLKMGSETSDGLRRTLRGFFAILGIGWEILKGVVRYIAEFFGLLSQGSGSILGLTGDIGDVIFALYEWLKAGDKIGGFFSAIIDAREAALSPIIDLFGVLLEKVRELLRLGLGAAFYGLLAAGKALTPVLEFVLELVGNLADYLTNKLANIEFGWLEDLGSNAQRVLQNIGGYFEQLDFSSLSAAGAAIKGSFAGMGAALSAIDFSRVTGLKDNIVTLFNVVRQNLPSFKELFDVSEGVDSASAGIKTISAGLAPLAATGGLVRRAFDGIVSAFQSIGNFLGPVWEGIKSVFGWLKDRITSFTADMGIDDGLAVINTGFFIALYMMIRSFVKKFGKMADSLTGVFENVGGVFDQLTKNLKTMQTDVRANIILKIAGALALLAVAVLVLSKIDVADLGKALGALAAILIMLVGALVVLEKSASLTGGLQMAVTAIALTALAVGLAAMAGALAILSRLSTKDIIKGLSAMAGVLAVVIGATAVLSKTGGATQMLVSAAAIGVLAVSMTALAGALKLFASIDTSTLLEGGAKIVAVIAGIALVMSLMPPNMLATAAGVFILANAMILLAGALKIMGSLSVAEIGKALLVLAGAMAILAVSMNLMAGAVSGAAAMLVMAAALAVLVPSLVILSQLSLKEIGVALLALAGAFAILGVAALVLTPVVPVMFALAGAMALLGVGVFAVGAGLLAFATGLATLAVSGAAGLAVLTAVITGVAQLIPLIMQQIGLGIKAFALVLAEAGPELVAGLSTVLESLLRAVIVQAPLIGEALVTIISESLTLVRALFPQFVETGVALVIALLAGVGRKLPTIIAKFTTFLENLFNSLAKATPRILEAGTNLVVAMLRGMQKRMPRIINATADLMIAILRAITRKLPKMIEAGVDLIIAILEGIGKASVRIIDKIVEIAIDVIRALGRQSYRLGSAGFNMVIDILTGLTRAIDKNSDRLGRAGGRLAVAIVRGMVNGIDAGADEIRKAAIGAAVGAVIAIKDKLGINSPSKVFAELGGGIPEGMALGIRTHARLVDNEAERMGVDALDVMRTTMRGISDLAMSEIDSSPVITPILDLSRLEREATQIGTRLGTPQISAVRSRATANSILEENSAAAEAASDGSVLETGPREIRFEQNNYSPKALSPGEIYRNTKSQIALAREELKK